MWAGLVCCLAVSFCPKFCSSTASQACLTDQIKSRFTATVLGSSGNTCWTWTEQHSSPSERAGEGERKTGSHCVVFCVSPHEFVREMKGSLKPSSWEWKQGVGSGETAPNLFVLFLMFTVLPELVNHMAASATTAYWLNDDIYSTSSTARTAGVCLQRGFCCLLFSFGGGWRCGGVNPSILSNYIIENVFLFCI